MQHTDNNASNTGAEKTESVYLSMRTNNTPWDIQPQWYLGDIKWSDAVRIAKMQECPTRLSNSPGYNNQGHYFESDKTRPEAGTVVFVMFECEGGLDNGLVVAEIIFPTRELAEEALKDKVKGDVDVSKPYLFLDMVVYGDLDITYTRLGFYQ